MLQDQTFSIVLHGSIICAQHFGGGGGDVEAYTK